MTILREWRARVPPEKAEEARDFYLTKFKPGMVKSPGFISASFGRRDLSGLVEFVLISHWRDIDAVAKFAGAAPEKAVLLDGIEQFDADADNFVRLYEVDDQC